MNNFYSVWEECSSKPYAAIGVGRKRRNLLCYLACSTYALQMLQSFGYSSFVLEMSLRKPIWKLNRSPLLLKELSKKVGQTYNFEVITFREVF